MAMPPSCLADVVSDMTEQPFDTDLAELPPADRWRIWMARAEAVLFASAEPVDRTILVRVLGPSCPIDLVVEDVAAALSDRPYEIARVAGGWQMRSRAAFAQTIRTARGETGPDRSLNRREALVLASIAYLQPVTRAAIGRLTGREVGRDLIGRLHRSGLIARGPRSPEPGAPYTYVTTPAFLTLFGLNALRDLPDLEALQDAGLLAPDPPGLDALPLAPEDPEE